jgi:hypothetical protein
MFKHNINQEQTGGEGGFNTTLIKNRQVERGLEHNFNQEQTGGQGGFNKTLTKNRQVGRGALTQP